MGQKHYHTRKLLDVFEIKDNKLIIMRLVIVNFSEIIITGKK